MPQFVRAFSFSAIVLGWLAIAYQPLDAAPALSYTKNYFLTGDYVVAGVGLRGTGVNGFASNTLTVSGVPLGADIVAAFLYWQSVETTAAPSSINGFFDGKAIVGAPRGSAANPACDSSALAKGRVYRADVLRYLAVDQTNNVRIANGPHTVKLPDSGGGLTGRAPYTNGATLVVVYRGLSLSTALRSVVIYDGAYTATNDSDGLELKVGGFYQAASGYGAAGAKMTQIVGNGQSAFSSVVSGDDSVIAVNPFKGAQSPRWDNPTFNIKLEENDSSFETQASVSGRSACLTWSALILSTNVKDSDGDGLLDVWETRGMHLRTGDATHEATFGTCADYAAEPCVNLPAMGATANKKDVFIELDWLHGTDGHLHMPKLPALKLVGDAFNARGISVHFDVGNNYQAAPRSPYVIPYSAALRGGGEVIEERTLSCQNKSNYTCDYSEPYAVQGWKIGFRAVKDGFPVLGMSPHFARNRKDIFHYVLFGHALAGPFDAAGKPTTRDPKSVSGVADRPGGDLMITLGLWRSDDGPGCSPAVDCADQTGSTLVQAGTLMHELGHNLGLSHAGLFRVPNCEPNYPSVMNYLYQTRGLIDAGGNPHIDYSYGSLPGLEENNLSETVFPSNLQYRIRFYGPVGPNNPNGLGAAKAHCDGTPLNGDLSLRLDSPIGSYIDWNNNGKLDNAPGSRIAVDIDFNGVIGDPVKDSVDPKLAAGAPGKRYLVDSNDWGSLNLRQIGARLNVSGLSADVHLGQTDLGQTDLGQTDLGQTDLGQTDLGQTDLGQTDLGQTDLGQTDLGQTDLGQTDLGQTDLGDVDFDTVIATLDPIDPAKPLTANTPADGLGRDLNGVTLNWGAPGIGQIRQYNIHRTSAGNTTPVLIGSVSGAPPLTTYTDVVNSSSTLYNVNYTYFVTSVDIKGTESTPSNTASAIVKHLFIAANPVTRNYGDANPASFTFTTTGQDAGLAGTTTCGLSSAITASSNAGSYPNAITCTGRTPAAGVTYTSGTFTIVPVALSIAAVTSSKTYDGTTAAPGATPIATGLKLAKDTVSPLIETFNSKNAGTSVGLTVTSYMVNDGNAGGNYTVTLTGASGSIAQKTASVTPNASGKVFGAADPGLSGSLVGFVAGDGITAVYTRAAGENVAGSPYLISATLGPVAALANYNITYNTAGFIITPSAQAITFAALANQKSGAPDFNVSATSTSGLSVSFIAGGSCTVTGSLVHLTGSGTCTITAQQSGTVNYLPAADVPQTFSISDGFASVDFTTLTANGNAIGGATANQITMTNAVGQASSAWYPGKLTVSSGFTTQFQFRLTGVTNPPADGFAFVIQNSGSTAIGGAGGGIGYDGISQSLAVEFDTYLNQADLGDPNANHIGVQSNGAAANSAHHGTGADLGIASALASTLADGNLHDAKITYGGTAKTMTVFLDSTMVLTTAVDLTTLGLDAGGKAFIGFTSATGASGEVAVLSGWSFSAN